jgi:hypothetical protein
MELFCLIGFNIILLKFDFANLKKYFFLFLVYLPINKVEIIVYYTF